MTDFNEFFNDDNISKVPDMMSAKFNIDKNIDNHYDAIKNFFTKNKIVIPFDDENGNNQKDYLKFIIYLYVLYYCNFTKEEEEEEEKKIYKYNEIYENGDAGDEKKIYLMKFIFSSKDEDEENENVNVNVNFKDDVNENYINLTNIMQKWQNILYYIDNIKDVAKKIILNTKNVLILHDIFKNVIKIKKVDFEILLFKSFKTSKEQFDKVYEEYKNQEEKILKGGRNLNTRNKELKWLD